jgi:ATP-binding cassette, subfamily B (MDR/TAP), member 1
LQRWNLLLSISSLVSWYGISYDALLEIDGFVFVQSTTFGSIQAGAIFNFVPDISSAKGAGSDIINLLDTNPKIDAESSGGKRIPEDQVHGKISFDNVHFRYPTRPGVRVLRGLSINVEPGTYAALVGGSGSGKSTVYVGYTKSLASLLTSAL